MAVARARAWVLTNWSAALPVVRWRRTLERRGAPIAATTARTNMVMVVSMSVKPRRLYPIRIEQVLVPMLLGRFQSPFFGSNPQTVEKEVTTLSAPNRD